MSFQVGCGLVAALLVGVVVLLTGFVVSVDASELRNYAAANLASSILENDCDQCRWRPNCPVVPYKCP
jgi:hypothetical protein